MGNWFYWFAMIAIANSDIILGKHVSKYREKFVILHFGYDITDICNCGGRSCILIYFGTTQYWLNHQGVKLLVHNNASW